jgi:hypothetical protein
MQPALHLLIGETIRARFGLLRIEYFSGLTADSVFEQQEDPGEDQKKLATDKMAVVRLIEDVLLEILVLAVRDAILPAEYHEDRSLVLLLSIAVVRLIEDVLLEILVLAVRDAILPA